MECYKNRAFCSSDCVNYKCTRCRKPKDFEKAKELGLPFRLIQARCNNYLRPKETKMKIRPLQNYIVVQRKESIEVTKGGIFLPENAREKSLEGVVLAVGSGVRDAKGKLEPLTVKEGDRVLFGDWAGLEIKVSDQTVFMLKESDIMGIIQGE